MENDYSQHADRGGKTGGIAQTGSGPAAAGESAAADDDAAAAAHGGTASVNKAGIAERAKKAPWWSKLFGILGLLVTIATTVLVLLDKTDLAVAGFILGVAGMLLGVVGLFR